MLKDVDVRMPSGDIALIIGLIADRGPTVPKRISRGMYLSGHWNARDCVSDTLEEWVDGVEFPTSGVCDYPDQVQEKFDLDGHEKQFFVSFVRIRREDESPSGGWRWHKWGEYIGDKDPQYEYLYDEKDIDEVYTYTVFEVKND